MKVDTFLNAYAQASFEETDALRIATDWLNENYTLVDKALRKSSRRARQSSAFRARLLSMYSLDPLRRLEQSRDYWQRRAYLADQENRDLRERLEDLENAWAVDETIQPDGSLRPSLADTARRAAELEWEIGVWKERAKAAEQSLYGAGDPEYLIYCTNAWDAGMASMTYIDWLKKKSAKPESEQPPQAAEGGRDG